MVISMLWGQKNIWFKDHVYHLLALWPVTHFSTSLSFDLLIWTREIILHHSSQWVWGLESDNAYNTFSRIMGTANSQYTLSTTALVLVLFFFFFYFYRMQLVLELFHPVWWVANTCAKPSVQSVQIGGIVNLVFLMSPGMHVRDTRSSDLW